MTSLSSSFDWKRFFQVISVITLACAILGGLGDDADARKRKKRISRSYTPPYSEMVVDINSGRVLRAVNPDDARFPASITKVMTLYLLFEQIQKGKMSLSTPLEVSAVAASQAPSKLGLRPGSTIAVEDAILALVTKSANDVAVTVAENIAGDQDSFARLMTSKARALGMSRTTFRNASGLPNPQQVTTARDLVRLGVAMKRDFPKFYPYFKTRAFAYNGAVHRNHNRLLGRVDGVDGIKTGYTRASGFNLLTSAREGNRQIMTVVLGGRSGGARDARVAQLVGNYLGSASSRATPDAGDVQVASVDAAALASAGDEAEDGAAPRASSTRLNGGNRPIVAAVDAMPERLPGKSDRKARLAVITAEGTTPAESADVSAYASEKPQLVGPAVLRVRKDKRMISAAKPKVAAMLAAPEARPAEPDLKWMVGQEPAREPAQDTASSKGKKGKVKIAIAASDMTPDMTITNATPTKGKLQAKAAAAAPLAAAPAVSGKKPVSGWVIQLAAAENEEQAMKILNRAKAKQARILGDAVAFTEQVQKGDATLWRARFGGFDGDSDAQAACSALKKSGFNCLAQRA